MVMAAVLDETDFRKATRLLLADGWHSVTGFRWVEPVPAGKRHDGGIASDWAAWWEREGISTRTRTIFAPTSSILAYSFSDDPE